MANKIEFQVGFGIDKQSYQQLVDSLDRVIADMNGSAKNTQNNGLKKQFEDAAKAAQDLQNVLNKSWDAKLNQINLTKLNTELKDIGMTATQMYEKIGKSGAAGAESANRFASQILNANIQLKESNKLLDRMAVTFKNTVRYGISSSIFNNLTNSIQKAYNYTKNLDTSLNDIRIVSNQSAEQMEQFAVSANKAAQALGRTTLDYTKAATIYYQQGLSPEEIEARTQVTLKAANVTGQNAQDVSEQLTAVWNGYQVTGEHLEEYVDKLSAVAATSASNLEELSTGMSKVASAANIMGVDIDQLTAQMSTIISVTRQAPESVGTALRTIYARIADIKSGLDDETSLGNYSGKMAKLGFNVLDATGNLKDMGDVIEEIGGRWKSLSREQQIALAQVMAGTRQYNNLLTLFDNWSMYEKALETSAGAAGKLQEQQDIYMESTEAHLKQLQAQSEQLYKQLFDQEAVKSFIDVLTGGLKTVSNYIKTLGGGFNAFLGIGSQIANLFSNQIATSINQKIDNRLIGQQQADNIKIKQSQIDQAKFEGKDIYSQSIEKEVKYANEILSIRKNISQEEYKELTEEQKKVGALEREILQNKRNLQIEKARYELKKKETENSSNSRILKDLQNSKYKDFNFDKYGDVQKALEKESIDLNAAIEENNNENYDTAQSNIEALKERLELLKDVNDLEEKGVVLKQDQNELEQDLNNRIKSGKRKTNLREYVVMITAITQAVTLLSGAIKTLADDTASTEDKVTAAMDTIFGGLAAAANMALPGSGMLIQGIGEIAKSFGLEEWVKILETGEEKLARVTKQQEEFKKGVKETWDTIDQAQKGIDQLEEFENRFIYLQSLAEKGLLTPELQDEYEGYLKEVKKYNDDALIFYDEQGKLTTSNKNIIAETVQLQKELIKEQQKEQYSNKKWKEWEEADRKEAEAKNKVLSEKMKKVADSRPEILGVFEGTRETKDISGKAHTWGNYQNFGNYIDFAQWLGVETAYGAGTNFNRDEYIEKANEAIENKKEEILKGIRAQVEQQYVNASAEEKEAAVQKQYETTIKNLQKEVKTLANMFNEATDAGDAFLDTYKQQASTLVNFMKYGEEESASYAKVLEEIGVENENAYLQILEDYVNKSNETNKYLYDKNGNLTKNALKNLKNDLVQFQKDFNEIWNKNDNIKTIYQRFLDIDINKGTAQKYEEEVQKRIQEFLKELNKEDYEKIKPFLANIFGLDNLNTYWNEESGQAEVAQGTNQVTKGERRARDIGEKIAQEIADSNPEMSEENKKKVQETIENFLQTSMSEADLRNLDMTEFADIFIDKFNSGLLTASNSKDKKFNFMDILKQSITQTGDSYNDKVNIERAKELGYSEKALEHYGKQLQKVNPLLKDNKALTQECALAQMELTQDLKEMSEQWGSWEANLDKWDKDSPEYSQTISEIANSLGKVFDTEVTSDFVEEHLGLIKKMMKGDAEAFNQLQDLAAKDYIANLEIRNVNEEDIPEIKNQLQTFIEEYDGKELGFTAKMNDSAFVNKLNEMLQKGQITEKQMNNILGGIGYTPKTEGTKTIKGPQEQITASIKTPWGPMELGTITTQSTVQVPIIKSIEKTGSDTTNTNTFNSAVKPNSNSSKGKGSTAKPSKKDPNKDELDRYQKVNVQLKELSKSLTTLEKQRKKLLGKDLIVNLNKQIANLNRQIEVTKNKLEIAKQEQKETANKLSGYGVTFDDEGNIANYQSIFQKEQNRLNQIYANYNKMSKASQENYQDVVKAAEERFKAFKEAITKYDTLIGDTLPGLEQDLIDKTDKIIEINIEKFNKEIEIRLDLAKAKKEWNKFRGEVINGWKDTDIDKWAENLLKDFSILLNNNGGIVGRMAQHLQKTLDEVKAQIPEGGVADWYGDNRAKAMEDLKDDINSLEEVMTQVQEAKTQMDEYLVNVINTTQEKFDEQLDNFEAINKQLEHNIELIELIYGDDSYSRTEEQQKAVRDNSIAQLAYLKEQKDYYDDLLKVLDEDSDAWEEAKKGAEAANEALIAGMLDAMNKAKEAFETGVQAVIKDITDKLTNGKGLDLINKQWELMNENSQLELDNINRMQGLQDIAKKYNDAINGTSSVKAQKELAKLRDKELEDLKEIGHLSEKDLQRAEKKLEIAKLQMALEEAQQNKSQMRLRRDSQGNYRYQFVADEDEVNKAQEQLSLAYNELYNFDKDRALEVESEMVSTYQQYCEDIANLRILYGDDEEKYKEEKRILEEQYNKKMAILEEQRLLTQQNLYSSTFANLNSLYSQSADNYNLMTEAQKAALGSFEEANKTAFGIIFGLEDQNTAAFRNMADEEKNIIESELIPQWKSGFSEMIDEMTKEGGFEQVATNVWDEITKKINEYFDAIKQAQDSTGLSFSEILNTQNKMIKQSEEWIKKTTEDIQKYDTMTQKALEFYQELQKQAQIYQLWWEDAKETWEEAIELYDKLKEKEAEEVRTEIEENGTGGNNENPDNGGNGGNEPSNPEPPKTSHFAGIPNMKDHSDLTNVVYGIWQGCFGNGATRAARLSDLYTSDGAKIIQALVNRTEAYKNNKSGLSTYLEKLGYDTGGYTGEWGNEGRLAFLHQKELVLNKQDTANMLNAVEIMRGITNNIGADLLGRIASMTASGFNSSIGGSILDQNVHIEATFPGVKSSVEIQDALNNLVNMAAQRATKTR